MFDGVDLGGIHDRFLIRIGDTDVKGGDDGISGIVFSGNIDSRNKFVVVNGETCDLFHKNRPFLS